MSEGSKCLLGIPNPLFYVYTKAKTGVLVSVI